MFFFVRNRKFSAFDPAEIKLWCFVFEPVFEFLNRFPVIGWGFGNTASQQCSHVFDLFCINNEGVCGSMDDRQGIGWKWNKLKHKIMKWKSQPVTGWEQFNPRGSDFLGWRCRSVITALLLAVTHVVGYDERSEIYFWRFRGLEMGEWVMVIHWYLVFVFWCRSKNERRISQRDALGDTFSTNH